MMRAPKAMAIAVRRPDGTIVVRDDAWRPLVERLKFLRLPGIRGALVLAESIYNGVQALNFAAEQSEITTEPQDEIVTEQTESAEPTIQTISEPDREEILTPLEKLKSAATVALSLSIALGLFVALPHLLAYGAGQLSGGNFDVDSFVFHLLDGVFKIAIFVGYIAGISLIPEIRRVFEYHGAEHKVVNLFEQGQTINLESARSSPTFHARCGTSFMLFVLVLSIFVFAAIFPMIPRVAENNILNHLAMVFIKIPLMFPLAGLAYEINRYASKHPDQAWVQLIVFPGRLMQKLTTKEPDDSQLEIAMVALRTALQREAQLQEAAGPATETISRPASQVLVFNTFADTEALFPGH